MQDVIDSYQGSPQAKEKILGGGREKLDNPRPPRFRASWALACVEGLGPGSLKTVAALNPDHVQWHDSKSPELTSVRGGQAK